MQKIKHCEWNSTCDPTYFKQPSSPYQLQNSMPTTKQRQHHSSKVQYKVQYYAQSCKITKAPALRKDMYMRPSTYRATCKSIPATGYHAYYEVHPAPSHTQGSIQRSEWQSAMLRHCEGISTCFSNNDQLPSTMPTTK